MQNDFCLTSGEATVRNLLIGSALASEVGKCGRIGYAPGQFGNISNFIFGRGFRYKAAA